LRGAELRDGEGNSGEEGLIGIDDFLRELAVKKGSVRGNRALVLVFVAMRGDQIRAIRGTIDGDFAFRSAADGADFLALGGTISGGFAFFTDRTGHEIS
jgi:hypothetical protein